MSLNYIHAEKMNILAYRRVCVCMSAVNFHVGNFKAHYFYRALLSSRENPEQLLIDRTQRQNNKKKLKDQKQIFCWHQIL